MILAGVSVGHVTRLAAEAQSTIARSTRLEAAARERLARSIHDSVLQVLARDGTVRLPRRPPDPNARQTMPTWPEPPSSRSARASPVNQR
jgi:signal transduction histidine kinase